MDYALLSRLSIQSTSDQEEYDMYAQISANAATGVAPEQAAVFLSVRAGETARKPSLIW